MPVVVEILGNPPVNPEPGSVYITVKLSGLNAVRESELGPAFSGLRITVAWGHRHEPHFELYVPLSVSDAGASLACNMFLQHYVLKNDALKSILAWVSVVPRFYGTCYYSCGTKFWGDDSDRPEGWTAVTCAGCKSKLGLACASCSTKRTCVERCDPPCSQCLKMDEPATSPAPQGEQGNQGE